MRRSSGHPLRADTMDCNSGHQERKRTMRGHCITPGSMDGVREKIKTTSSLLFGKKKQTTRLNFAKEREKKCDVY